MILVAGSTSQLGGLIVHRLLTRGKSVRVLVHPDTDYDHLERAGCEPSLGDIKFPESFGPAFRGVDTVIAAASATEPDDPIDTIQRLDLEGNRNLIDAAQAAGVRQFVFVSALGADPAHADPYFAAKGQAEAYLRASGLSYTILAAAPALETWLAYLVERPLRAGQPASVVGRGTRCHSLIAQADLAAFAAVVVGHPAAQNQTIAIGGPEPVSWLGVIRRLSAALGRELPVRHYLPGAPLPGLSLEISQVAAFFETAESVVEMAHTAATFGVRLTPLDVTLAGMVSEMVSMQAGR